MTPLAIDDLCADASERIADLEARCAQKQLAMEQWGREYRALEAQVAALEEEIRQLKFAAEFEARTHAEALQDATSPCHGLGCGKCEDCVHQLTAQCAGMREALLVAQQAFRQWATVHGDVNTAIEAALAPDCGKALLERLEKAEKALMVLTSPDPYQDIHEQLGVVMRGVRGKANPGFVRALLEMKLKGPA